jgi:uncharacterized protein (TIGR02001 family)
MAGFPETGPIHAVRTRALARFPLAAAVCVLATSQACADGLGGALGFASDNVYRGLSLTADRPTWVLDLHYDLGPDWVAGLGGSAERLTRQSMGAQITAYVDRRWQLDADWAAKIGAVHYDSAGSIRGSGLNYDEVNAAIGYRGRWRASIALSPNTGAVYAARQTASGFGAWAELTYHQPIGDRFSADVGIGYADLTQSGVRNYRYGSTGLGYRVGDTYFYLTHTWTSPLVGAYPQQPYGYHSPTRTRWVASVIWSFQGS